MRKHISKKALIPLIAVLVLLCGTVIFFAMRRDITYRFKTDLQAAFAPTFALQEAETDTIQVSLAELQADSRVQFDQSMMLISDRYLLTEDFSADVSAYGDSDVIMNTCIHDAYRALAEHIAQAFNQKLYVRSAFRTPEEQQEEEQSNADTATKVGASEHQAGLALDVYVPYYAGKAFLKTEVGRYVNSHCYEYGFIIRYPSYGKSETGIPFEPWHLRYVGFPHAEIIAKHYLTLEEYIASMEHGKLYAYQTYVISRQNGDTFEIPQAFKAAVVSQDNTGGYVLTFQI